MLNTERAEEKKEHALLIVEMLEETTTQLLTAAQTDEWEIFLELVAKRHDTLKRLENFLPATEKVGKVKKYPELRDESHTKGLFDDFFQKVVKVNDEILDIINHKKKTLFQKLGDTQKSIKYLKAYKKDVNRKKIISKVC